MIVRGAVIKTADSDAILTMSIGGDTRVHSWPRTSRVIDVPTKYVVLKRCGAEEADHRECRLLPACRERPRRRAAEKRDEGAARHSITSLARAMNASDKDTPSDAAVLRLTAM